MKTLVTAVIQKSPSKGGKLDMDNFIPDTETIDNFLDDDASPRIENLKIDVTQDNSEDEVDNNPMVASFAEDVEIDEYSGNAAPIRESSSSEDDEVVIKPKVTMSSKTTLKTKLSNTSSTKSDDLHFELPDHLKNNELENDIFDNINPNTNETKKKHHHKKNKKSKKSKKSKSEDQERDELEEFLNGVPANTIQPEEGAYEEL